jgi:hypothetical protein
VKNITLRNLFLDGLLHPQAVQRWSIEQIRTCPWLVNQTFLPEVPPFPLNLTNFWTSVNKDLKKSASTSDSLPTMSSFEDEAHSKLEDLGITSELLRSTTMRNNSDSTDLSNRYSINGTYRIILHRLQKQSNPLEREDLAEKMVNDDLSASWGRSMSVHGESVGRTGSFGKPISMSYGGGTTKTKRNLEQTHQSRKGQSQAHQQTKVCSIL